MDKQIFMMFLRIARSSFVVSSKSNLHKKWKYSWVINAKGVGAF